MIPRLAFFLFLVPVASGGVVRHTYALARSTRSVNDWHCGIGSISGGISNALTYFMKDQQKINICCMEHDDLLEVEGLNRMEVDRIFCECLDNVGSSYVMYVIKPLFCTVIRMYSDIFHRDEPS